MAKPIRMIRLLIVLSAVLIAFGAMTAQAQTNLLQNPGFEAPFISVGGNDLVQVAQGWTPWHVPQGSGDTSSQNLQPEYYPASDVSNGLGIPRIRSGADAQQYFTFFGTHTGGVFQRVTGITPGTELRFSAFAYVWSSSFDDPDVSEEDGGVLLQVGIDPAGGTDGQSASIIWSSAVPLYDAFNEYVVTATASGSAVSVWVRSIVSFPVRNNNIYVDDASLTAAGDTSPTSVPVVPTNTPVPPSNTPVPPTNTAVPPTTAPAQPTNTPVPPTTAPAQPSNTPVVSVPTDVPPTSAVPTAEGPTVEGPTAVPPTAVPPTSAPPTSVPPTVQISTNVPPTATPTPSEIFRNTIIHTVRAGDTVSRIATLYGSTIAAIISANGLDENALIFVGQQLVVPVKLAAPATVTPTNTPLVPPTTVPGPTAAPPVQPPTTGTQVYVVRPGDTLYRIAVNNRTTIAALLQLNRITNPNLIFVGQQILVPAPGTPVEPQPQPQPQPTTYRVQPGDTLYRIALRSGVSLTALIQANNLTNPNRIFVGQVLIIP